MPVRSEINTSGKVVGKWLSGPHLQKFFDAVEGRIGQEPHTDTKELMQSSTPSKRTTVWRLDARDSG